MVLLWSCDCSPGTKGVKFDSQCGSITKQQDASETGSSTATQVTGSPPSEGPEMVLVEFGDGPLRGLFQKSNPWVLLWHLFPHAWQRTSSATRSLPMFASWFEPLRYRLNKCVLRATSHRNFLTVTMLTQPPAPSLPQDAWEVWVAQASNHTVGFSDNQSRPWGLSKSSLISADSGMVRRCLLYRSPSWLLIQEF